MKVGLSSHQPVCVCVPVINLNRLVDLDEILYGGDGIEDDHDYILFNAVASTIPKWLTFKVLRWVQILNRLVDLDKMYECRESRHISSSQNFLLIIIILLEKCM
jgi:tryptophan 2,3-dioxygenase